MSDETYNIDLRRVSVGWSNDDHPEGAGRLVEIMIDPDPEGNTDADIGHIKITLEEKDARDLLADLSRLLTG